MTYLTLLAPPLVEPVSLAEVKAHLRIDHKDEDGPISSYIRAATISMERWLRRALVRQDWRLTLDTWPIGSLRFPKPPLIAVNAVTLSRLDGSEDILDPQFYRVESRAEPGFLIPVGRTSLPEPGQRPGGIGISFTAGYGSDGSAVPEPIRQALLMMVGSYYENRSQTENPVSGAIRSLLSPYRVVRL